MGLGMCSTDKVEKSESIVGFGVFTGFVDNKKNTELHQPQRFPLRVSEVFTVLMDLSVKIITRLRLRLREKHITVDMYDISMWSHRVKHYIHYYVNNGNTQRTHNK